MTESERDAAQLAAWHSHKRPAPAYQPPRARLLLQLEGAPPVDVCSADLWRDPRRLALLVEVALQVELNRALNPLPANATVSKDGE